MEALQTSSEALWADLEVLDLAHLSRASEEEEEEEEEVEGAKRRRILQALVCNRTKPSVLHC